jgi:hypothetical protein
LFIFNCRREFNDLVESHGMQVFSRPEITFLEEYERVMKPISIALDQLQSEKYSYMGCLLPVILTLKKSLDAIGNGLTGSLAYCRPLLVAVKTAVNTRFLPMFEDRDYQIASCLHPHYKFVWTRIWDESRVPEMKELMIQEVANYLRKADPAESQPVTASQQPSVAPQSEQSFDSDDGDGNMDSLLRAAQSRMSTGSVTGQQAHSERARELVKTWDATPITAIGKPLTDEAFIGSQILIDLFCQTNTGVVSSAAVERFFSQGKDTLRAKRSNLSDKNFESLMFLRGNAHLWAAPGARKRRELARRQPHPALEKLMDKCM